MKIRSTVLIFICLLLAFATCGCAAASENDSRTETLRSVPREPLQKREAVPESEKGQAAASDPEETQNQETETEEENMLIIQIGDRQLTAVLENNRSAEALKALLADGPVTVKVENYGGFEKVGRLPETLPGEDSQITAQPGDIMLYQRNSIVFFYGSNSWAYTRLGTICENDTSDLREILAGEADTVTLFTEQPVQDETAE